MSLPWDNVTSLTLTVLLSVRKAVCVQHSPLTFPCGLNHSQAILSPSSPLLCHQNFLYGLEHRLKTVATSLQPYPCRSPEKLLFPVPTLRTNFLAKCFYSTGKDLPTANLPSTRQIDGAEEGPCRFSRLSLTPSLLEWMTCS